MVVGRWSLGEEGRALDYRSSLGSGAKMSSWASFIQFLCVAEGGSGPQLLTDLAALAPDWEAGRRNK